MDGSHTFSRYNLLLGGIGRWQLCTNCLDLELRISTWKCMREWLTGSQVFQVMRLAGFDKEAGLLYPRNRRHGPPLHRVGMNSFDRLNPGCVAGKSWVRNFPRDFKAARCSECGLGYHISSTAGLQEASRVGIACLIPSIASWELGWRIPRSSTHDDFLDDQETCLACCRGEDESESLKCAS
jgi:hypothetical protein